MMSAATASFVFFGKSLCPSAEIMLIWFSSVPKHVPLFFSEFSTMKSRFLRFSFEVAFVSSLSVSSAKPISLCFSVLRRPSSAAMSCVGCRLITRLSFSRFILLGAIAAGRKSATAAHNIAASACSKALMAASYISSQHLFSLSSRLSL